MKAEPPPLVVDDLADTDLEETPSASSGRAAGPAGSAAAYQVSNQVGPDGTPVIKGEPAFSLAGGASEGGAKSKKPPLCPKRLVLFCSNLFLGLLLSQLIPEWLEPEAYFTYRAVVKVVTMFHLSYIMINVGFEFELDKSRLRSYGKDYLVACTAASFPWLFVSLYFMFALGEEHNVPWREALVAARFAAPTSAGILFTMLEAAGARSPRLDPWPAHPYATAGRSAT